MEFSAAMTLLVMVSLLATLVLAIWWAISTVFAHARSNPEAARAIYEHVFLPVLGSMGGTKPKAQAKPAQAATPRQEMVVES